MESTIEKKHELQGGEFLVKSSDFNDTFIPEEFNEEQKMIQETILDFIKSEITPNISDIEKQKGSIAADLIKKFGDLGFLSTHMPESLGGMDLDFNTNTMYVTYTLLRDTCTARKIFARTYSRYKVSFILSYGAK